MTSMKSIITESLKESAALKIRLAEELSDKIEAAAQLIIDAYKKGKKVLLFGNGGSAADAQHIAAEWVGRYKKERPPLPAIAPTTDTSALTCISNDYSYESVFKRQVEALAVSGDVLIGITTSGKSPNVLKALETGRKKGCRSIGLGGNPGSPIASYVEVPIIVPSHVTARIQECHITIGHIICELVDEKLFPSPE